MSDETKTKFRNEIEKKRKIRKSKANVEKKADRMAKKREEERIKALKERYPSIDPDDEFFHSALISTETSISEDVPQSLLDESFGPTLQGNTNPNTSSLEAESTVEAKLTGSEITPPLNRRAPPISFRNACLHENSSKKSSKKKVFDASNADFPSLSSTPNQAPISTTKSKPSWGSVTSSSPAMMRTQPSKSNTKANSSSVLSLDHLKLGESPRKRGNMKGKKVVLFSTGGHRGR